MTLLTAERNIVEGDHIAAWFLGNNETKRRQRLDETTTMETKAKNLGKTFANEDERVGDPDRGSTGILLGALS
jgi:hypothetical protein